MIGTGDHLAREIVATQRALREAEQRHRSLLDEEEDVKTTSHDDDRSSALFGSPIQRLKRLQHQVTEVELVQQVSEYVRNFGNADTDDDDYYTINDWPRLEALGSLLLRHHPPQPQPPQDSSSSVSSLPLSLYHKLYQDEFLPLCDYMESNGVRQLRRLLTSVDYPRNCHEWLRQCEEEAPEAEQQTPPGAGVSSDYTYAALESCCHTLSQVARYRDQVVSHVTASPPTSTSDRMDPVLVELCRPLVERLRHHFVDPHSNPHPTSSSSSSSNITTQRVDRLPEWVLTYVRQHVFETGGAWELIYYGLSSSSQPSLNSLAVDFLNEVLRMIQWVLSERQFFRHPTVVGPNSNPWVLCRAVEQLLQFDAFLQSRLDFPSFALRSSRVLRLMDVCIAGDEELCQWWLARERECVLATFQQETQQNHKANTADVHKTIRMFHPAELFAALMRSIRHKAAVFTHTGPYLSQVATPLCERFVDGVHATAVHLKRFLTQRAMPSDVSLIANVQSWKELVHGTRLAATELLHDDDDDDDNEDHDARASLESSSSSAEMAKHDLMRFGRSLERLQGVLADEFVTIVVEVLLLERAKLAGYLMRCSHLLASPETDVIDEALTLTDISPDVQETLRIVELIWNALGDNGTEEPRIVSGAKLDSRPDSLSVGEMLQERLLSVLAEKLLECALDIQGLTPDLQHAGCRLFARDVQALLSGGQRRRGCLLPSHALRMIDISKFMCLSSPALSGMGGALCGLSGKPAPLTEDIFEADERLYDEAISMIRAKGFLYLELADVFAILNRRRDLF